MRGVKVLDTNPYLVDAILMSRYNQSYSEIENMPTELVLFLIRLLEAETKYEESEMKKIKGRQK